MIYFKKMIDNAKSQDYNAVIEHEDVLNDHLRALFLCDSKNKPPAMQGEGSSLDISNLLC